ncbi:hypothetical protein P67b_00040 [Ruegeria phage Tedan]|nr:hypothetical protein P67b_00040 [Ruegeria phage Tedan]
MIVGAATCLGCDADCFTHEFTTVTDRKTLAPKGTRIVCTDCGSKGPAGADEKEAKALWNELNDDGIRTDLRNVA